MTSLAEKEIKYNEAGFTQKEIADWKKEKVDLHKRPCIFILHKY